MVNFKNIKSKEGIDLSEFNMKDTKIEVVEVRDYNIEDKEKQTEVQDLVSSKTDADKEKLRLIVQTEILKEGTKLRATAFFNLFRDLNVTEGCNIRFSEGKRALLPKFLSHFGLKDDSLEDIPNLVGKECKTIIRKTDSGDERLEIYFGQ